MIEADDGQQALERLGESEPDLVRLDIPDAAVGPIRSVFCQLSYRPPGRDLVTHYPGIKPDKKFS